MSARAPVLIDNDGGLDDALAVALLARHPAVRLVGVGSVHGNVTTVAAAANSLRLLEILRADDVPVAIGAARPSAQPVHLSHPRDVLRWAVGTPRRSVPSTIGAADFLVRQAIRYAGELDVLAVGPLTNIAAALRIEPRLPGLVRRIVVMGGAFSGGNITAHAEANVWHDPEAAAEVFAAGFELTLVPLDLTRTVTASRRLLLDLARTVPSVRMSVGAAALALVAGRFRLRLHDPVAAAVLADRSLIRESTTERIRVELTDSARRGATSSHAEGGPATTVRAIDLPRFRTQLFNGIVGA